MRKVLFFIVLASCIACNSGKEAKVKSMESTASENIVYPAGIVPKKFVIGDANITANMLEVYKGWEDNNFELIKKHLADSMMVYGADGSVFGGTRDSAIAQMQAFRNMYKSMKPQYYGFVTLKDMDEDETWFDMWYKEYQTDLNGKTDSMELNENWKINKEGKAYSLYQFIHHNPAVPKK